MSLAITIIITLYLGSIRCLQDASNAKSWEYRNDRWILFGMFENDCKGNENEWINPTIIGFLLGQLIGAIFGIGLCIAFIYHCILKNLKFPS